MHDLQVPMRNIRDENRGAIFTHLLTLLHDKSMDER